jgi:hypothetical protein
MGFSTRRRRAARALAAGLALAFTGGCATATLRHPSYRYFEKPDPNDAWSRKIRAWQERERVEGDAPPTAPVAGPGAAPSTAPADGEDLKTKYQAFRRERRRALARDLASWIQTQAPLHYVPDGPVDHWATLDETFRTNGDDCDGLELLAFNMLRELGFDEAEVYRAIVYRRSDGQHHMVTLWFENPDDPWVIDPTGAMTLGMPHMSEVPGWVPIKVFSEDQEYTVGQR